MRIKLAILSIIIASYVNIYAQTTVQGNIKNRLGKAIFNAAITVKKQNVIVGYDYSDTQGHYKLTFNSEADSLSIFAAGFNVTPQSKRFKNKSQMIDFVIEEKEIRLKEVIVKSTKIWGAKDTLNYLVSSFSDKKDFVIGDVLKKMPGITVSSSGEINYQGRPINKFYIENMDMLQGRYGVATNNISVKDVSVVQVLENHQPIKALDKLKISGDAAINIKLREGAKGTFSIMGQLGIGASPLLWENELAGMYFSKKRQNITTYKTNNSGVDLSAELNSFSASNYFSGDNMLQIQMPSPPSIDKKRYLFNNSNVLTINNLFKTKKQAEFNFNLCYYNDHENRESNDRTSYFLPEKSLLVVDEGLKSAINTDKVEAVMRYNINKDGIYLNNFLKIDGQWGKGIGDVISAQNVHQELIKPSFSVTNVFHCVKRKEESKGFEFYSNSGFKTAPQELTIYPGLYSDIFNKGETYDLLKQKTSVNSFYSNNGLTLLSSIVLGNLYIDPRFCLNADSRTLDSKIYTKKESTELFLTTADSMRNDLSWIRLAPSLGMALRYNIGELRIEGCLPFNYNMIQINNQISSDKENLYRSYFQPSINFTYECLSNVKLSGGYNLYNRMGDIQTLYKGFILPSYRVLNRYDGRLMETKGNGGNLNISFRDMMSLFFCSVDLSYDYSKNNMLYNQRFQGVLSLVSSVQQDNVQQNFNVKTHISKGFDWKRLVTTIDASFGKFSSQQLRENKLINYKINGLNLTVILNCKPMPFLVLDYKGTWCKSWNVISSESRQSIKSFVNKLSLDVDLIKNLSTIMSYEHYYNSASIASKNVSFTDLGLAYVWGNVHYSLSWDNIFNNDNYMSAYYSEINTYQNIYHLRPSNIMFKIKLKLK